MTLPFALVWRLLLRPGGAASQVVEVVRAPTLQRATARRVPLLTAIRPDSTVMVSADLVRALLDDVSAAGPEGDEDERRRARDAFAIAAGLDPGATAALEASVDRFTTAMEEIAVLAGDDELARASPEDSAPARTELVENAGTAYRRGLEELDALIPAPPARPRRFLAAQLPASTRSKLGALARLLP